METSQTWSVPALAIIILLAVVPVYLLVRSWRQRARLSAAERAEIAGSPLTRLQKSAWWGLGAGVATLGTVSVLLNVYGVAEYWGNDQFRLKVLAIFIIGLAACASFLVGAVRLGGDASRLDERDRKVMSQAGAFQTAFIIVTMAIWLVTMGERFHDTGAVPMVYLYLMFGSVVLINFIAQSVGILVGYWLGERFGQA